MIVCLIYFRILSFIYFIFVLGLRCSMGFSLVAESGGYSLVAGLGLLTAVAFLVEEQGL